MFTLNEDFYENLLDRFNDGVYFLDRDFTIFFLNQAAEKITGYIKSEVINRPCQRNTLFQTKEQGLYLCKNLCPAKSVLLDGKTKELKAYLRHKGGYRLPVYMQILPIHDKKKDIIGMAEIFCETSPKIIIPQNTQDLARMDLLDPVTNLGNRSYLDLYLKSRLEEMKKYGMTFGVLLVEADRLNIINEAYGIQTGKRVMNMIAQTIVKNIRFFDIAGIWDEGKFLVIVLDVDNPKLDFIANKLSLLISQSNIMEGNQFIRTSVSIGGTIVHSYETTQDIEKRLEELLKESKRLRQNPCLDNDR